MSASARVLGPLSLALALLLAACGAGAPGPTGADRAGASPAPSLDLVEVGVCESTVTMEDGLDRLKSIKVRRGSRGRLDQAMQSVLTGQDALLQRAPHQMRTRLRTLGMAVTNLTLALEDVRTTARIDVAAGNVKRSAAGLGKAIDSFQRWVGCGAAPAVKSPSVEG